MWLEDRRGICWQKCQLETIDRVCLMKNHLLLTCSCLQLGCCLKTDMRGMVRRKVAWELPVYIHVPLPEAHKLLEIYFTLLAIQRA